MAWAGAQMAWAGAQIKLTESQPAARRGSPRQGARPQARQQAERPMARPAAGVLLQRAAQRPRRQRQRRRSPTQQLLQALPARQRRRCRKTSSFHTQANSVGAVLVSQGPMATATGASTVTVVQTREKTGSPRDSEGLAHSLSTKRLTACRSPTALAQSAGHDTATSRAAV